MVVIFLLGLGIIDYLTGFEISFAFFYIFPVSLASWSLGKRPGYIAAVLSAVVWQGANLLAGEQFSSLAIIFWNAATRLGFFLIISSLLTEVRSLLITESHLSRTDALTDILNRRAFYEAASLELKKLERYGKSLSLVYLDMDDFKAVNDEYGHHTGDRVLQKVAERLKVQLRNTDFVARLGGDEFAVLLPETNESAVVIVVQRLQRGLLAEMVKGGWPVTVSMGVLTCRTAPANPDEMVHLADQLMYSAKQSGKNCIEYASYPDHLEEEEPQPERANA